MPCAYRVTGWRAIVLSVVFAIGARELHSQQESFDTKAPDSGLAVRRVVITTPAARFTVTRTVGRPVTLAVRTDSGTFNMIHDSATFAILADSVAAAPAPAPVPDSGQQVSFKFWGISALGDSGAHMRVARLSTSHGADVAVALSNGAWGIVEYLGGQLPEVLAALRGDTIVAPDSAHVAYEMDRAWPRLMPCNRRDSLRVMSTVVMGKTCGHGSRHVLRSAAAPPPLTYPPDLYRTGVTGTVYLGFVVDSMGRAEPQSVEILTSSQPAFARSCRENLLKTVFLPAQIDGRRVSEAVSFPCEFTVKGSGKSPEK
jgi:hypothetical protein